MSEFGIVDVAPVILAVAECQTRQWNDDASRLVTDIYFRLA